MMGILGDGVVLSSLSHESSRVSRPVMGRDPSSIMFNTMLRRSTSFQYGMPAINTNRFFTMRAV